MEIEYLEKWSALDDRWGVYEVPGFGFTESKARASMAREYAWAIPSPEALLAIKAASPKGVVEIGAGTGYWAMLSTTN